jgi:hypothetical protein
VSRSSTAKSYFRRRARFRHPSRRSAQGCADASARSEGVAQRAGLGRARRANWRPRFRLANRRRASPPAPGRQAKSAACLFFWKTRTLGARTTRSKGPQPLSGSVNDQSRMLSFVCTRIGEQDDLLLPAWATSSFTTVAGQAGWPGVKPSLDAWIYVAGVGSDIKAGASHHPMRIGPAHAAGV